MARLPLILCLLAAAGCAANPQAASEIQSPPFNDCWNKFPPGPSFQQQVEEYLQTIDPHKIKLMCAPQYHLNEDTCRQFKTVGPGDWPLEVAQWCQTQYGIELTRP